MQTDKQTARQSYFVLFTMSIYDLQEHSRAFKSTKDVRGLTHVCGRTSSVNPEPFVKSRIRIDPVDMFMLNQYASVNPYHPPGEIRIALVLSWGMLFVVVGE